MSNWASSSPTRQKSRFRSTTLTLKKWSALSIIHSIPICCSTTPSMRPPTAANATLSRASRSLSASRATSPSLTPGSISKTNATPCLTTRPTSPSPIATLTIARRARLRSTTRRTAGAERSTTLIRPSIRRGNRSRTQSRSLSGCSSPRPSDSTISRRPSRSTPRSHVSTANSRSATSRIPRILTSPSPSVSSSSGTASSSCGGTSPRIST